jgi:hypothetical protein
MFARRIGDATGRSFDMAQYTVKVRRTDMVYWYLMTPGGGERWISMHLQNPRHHVKVVVAVDEFLKPDLGQIYLFGPGSNLKVIILKVGRTIIPGIRSLLVP